MVAKMRNQRVREDYITVAKLKQDSAGAEDHRNTLAMAKALATGTLPAARKKSAHHEFSANTGDQGWLAGCTRNRRSWDRLCRDGNGARSTARAQRSSGGGD